MKLVAFPALVAWNLLAGVRALGTLMALRIAGLPAAVRFRGVGNRTSIAVAVSVAMRSSPNRLRYSGNFRLPSAAAIIPGAGLALAQSLVPGPAGRSITWVFPRLSPEA